MTSSSSGSMIQIMIEEAAPKGLQSAPKGMVQVEELVSGEFGLERKFVFVTKAEALKRREAMRKAYLKGLEVARVANNITRAGAVNRPR